MDYDGAVPGGDVSTLTLRRVKLLADEARRDRLAVAALLASLFPTTQQALDRLEGVLAAPGPAGGRTRAEKHLARLDGDTRMWAQEILPALRVMAARERDDESFERYATPEEKAAMDETIVLRDDARERVEIRPSPERQSSDSDDEGQQVWVATRWVEGGGGDDDREVVGVYLDPAVAEQHGDSVTTHRLKLPRMSEDDRAHLQAWMDLMRSNLPPWPEVRRRHPNLFARTRSYLKPEGDRACDTCGGAAWRVHHPGDSWVYECREGHTTVVGK